MPSMHQSAIILRPQPGWESVIKEVRPGAHVALLGTLYDSMMARRQGLVMRDGLTVMTPDSTLTLFLFRAPFDGDTVASNVLKHGVGGIHLAACHVGDDIRINQPCGSPENAYSGGWDSDPQPTLAIGRWPTNLMLIHRPECLLEGKVKLKVSAPPKAGVDIKDKYKQTYELGWSVRSTVHHGQDGWEEMDSWVCMDGCPAIEVDKQAKLQAARFYPQFKGMDDLLEWLKALLGDPYVVQ